MTVTTTDRWADLRLFCFPYSGAGASIFHRWAEKLPYHVEICAIQLPGRETRLSEPLYTRLPPLLESLGQALLPYLDKPFAVFGHSLGTLIAFELLRYLRREHGIQPIHFFAAGHSAPQLPREKPPIHALPDNDFAEELRRYNGTPIEVLDHSELRQLLFPILRADFAIYEHYAYEADQPLACPISAYGGLQDEEVTQDRLEAWREQTTEHFSFRLFPGDHFFLNTAQQPLLQQMAQVLNQVSGQLPKSGQSRGQARFLHTRLHSSHHL
jgi:medium-chain acyl-[acyl-carrier-protein] hydrolase